MNYEKDELTWKFYTECYVTLPPLDIYDYENYDSDLSYNKGHQQFNFHCNDEQFMNLIVGRNINGTVCGISNPIEYSRHNCNKEIEDMIYYFCNARDFNLYETCYEIKDSIHNSNHTFDLRETRYVIKDSIHDLSHTFDAV